ncbi:hypothetical protein QQG91_06410 [Marivivens sp. LCG002]|uniref:hypothetical protein n=1 Tax=Marivivens sp. LCG002 TaxID=3051171 RepID=UPI0025533269|nr:hypothetical protein [Marivivens sp. LCG002]WIV52069.1 hypothetical protein QQG91_06410 [Marivivens sp. LCG002]
MCHFQASEASPSIATDKFISENFADKYPTIFYAEDLFKERVNSCRGIISKDQLDALEDGKFITPTAHTKHFAWLATIELANRKVTEAIQGTSDPIGNIAHVGAISGKVRLETFKHANSNLVPSQHYKKAAQIRADFESYARQKMRRSNGLEYHILTVGPRVMADGVGQQVNQLNEKIKLLRQELRRHHQSEIILTTIELASSAKTNSFHVHANCILEMPRKALYDAHARQRRLDCIDDASSYQPNAGPVRNIQAVAKYITKSDDILKIASLDQSTIRTLAIAMKAKQMFRPGGPFADYRRSEQYKLEAPAKVRSGNRQALLMVRKDPRTEGPEKSNYSRRPLEADKHADDRPITNILCGRYMGYSPGFYFKEPILRIKNYDPNTSDIASRARLKSHLAQKDLFSFERNSGMTAAKAVEFSDCLTDLLTNISDLKADIEAKLISEALVATLESDTSDRRLSAKRAPIEERSHDEVIEQILPSSNDLKEVWSWTSCLAIQRPIAEFKDFTPANMPPPERNSYFY